MKLYSAPLSPFAARVRISIYRKNLDQIEILPPPGGLKSEAYLSLTPIGQIPALQLDPGVVIPESAAILEYLEDAFPAPSLRPANIELLARARLFMRLPDIHFQNAPRVLLGMRKPADRAPERVEAAFENLDKGLSYINHFIDAGPWAVGGTASIADSAILPILNVVRWVAEAYDRPGLFEAYPNIDAYWRAASTDAVHARVLGEQDEARKRAQTPQPVAA